MSFAGGEGRGREEGSPVSVFGAQIEKIQESMGPSPPSGVAVTGACGPPPMSPPRVRRARSLTPSLARAGEKRPRSSSRGHTSAPRFLSLTAALRNVRRARSADGRALRDASDYRIRRRSLMRSRPEAGPAADGTHD